MSVVVVVYLSLDGIDFLVSSLGRLQSVLCDGSNVIISPRQILRIDANRTRGFAAKESVSA